MDYYSNGYRMHGMEYGYGGIAPWGWILMVVVMALVILGVILLFRFVAGAQTKLDKDNPLDVLKHRYAKGEITKKQFDEVKQDLK